MADTGPVVRAEPVHFKEASDFFRQKVRLPTRAWTDLWQGQHARAFVIAGATKDELLADFQTSIQRMIDEGKMLADFRKDFDAIVAKHGWSYRGKRGWRSRVIYDTNLRMARASGRWEQIQRTKKTRPFIRYVAVLDSRTRPDHRAWHGTVRPADDAWWSEHTPPNGWYCRCTIQSLSQRDLARFNYEVTDAPPTKTVVKKVGNQSIPVPAGIDPGFAYNPGEAAFGRGADLVAQENHGAWSKLATPFGDRPRNPSDLAAVAPRATQGDRARGEAGLRQALTKALGAPEKIFTDPMGARISVGQGLIDHMLADRTRLDGRERFFPFIPELIEEPGEIWVGFAKSDVSGRTSIRRRYVRYMDIGDGRTVGMVADLDGGQWSGVTFYPGDLRGMRSIRSGLRIYRHDRTSG